jgi:type IV pilus assembly protein PilM
VKKISLPQMSNEELAESIHWEAEQYIPFDIQDVSIDYEVIEGGGSGGNMDVLLVAVKKDKIGDYTSAISQAGKNPRVVDVDVFALQNCYEINYGIDPGRVIALLNVGAAIMNINIIKGGTSIFNRDIAVGGNQYTDAIQKDLNLSFDQAEALKKGQRVEGAAPENLHPIIQAVSENIALEVQKTFDFFKATSSEDRIDRIFLSGGTSKIHGLRDLLADRFEAGVEIMNPFNNVTYNPKDFDPDFINDIGPSAAIAPMIRINLVAERKAGKAPAAVAGPAAAPGALQFYLLLFLFGGGAAAAAGAGYWYMSSEIGNLNKEIDKQEKEKLRLKPILEKVQLLERQRAQFKQQVELITRLKKDQALPVHMLDEISRALPDFVWLSSMDQKDTNLNFAGEASNNTAVADFMVGLLGRGDPDCAKARTGDKPPSRSLCWFPTVELVDSTLQTNGTMQFKLVGKVNNAEAAAEAARQAQTAPAPAGATPPGASPAAKP